MRDYSPREHSASLDPKRRRKKQQKPAPLGTPVLVRGGTSLSVTVLEEPKNPSMAEGPYATNFSTPRDARPARDVRETESDVEPLPWLEPVKQMSGQ